MCLHGIGHACTLASVMNNRKQVQTINPTHEIVLTLTQYYGKQSQVMNVNICADLYVYLLSLPV